MFDFELYTTQIESMLKAEAIKRLQKLELELIGLNAEKNKLKKLINPFWEMEEKLTRDHLDRQSVPYTPLNPWQPNITTPWTYPNQPYTGGGTGTPIYPSWTTTTCGTASTSSTGVAYCSSSNNIVINGNDNQNLENR